jgi:hypothetical protein
LDTKENKEIGTVCYFLTTDYTDKKDGRSRNRLYNKRKIINIFFEIKITNLRNHPLLSV